MELADWRQRANDNAHSKDERNRQKTNETSKTANIALLQRNKLYKALGSETKISVTETPKAKQHKALLPTTFEAKQIELPTDKLFN